MNLINFENCLAAIEYCNDAQGTKIQTSTDRMFGCSAAFKFVSPER